MGMTTRLFSRFLCGIGMAMAASTSVQADDRHDVVDALRAMFAAAGRDDLAGFHRATCQDFYAFDDGKRFSGDALMALIGKYHASGYVFVWNVTEPEVHVSGDVAWVTYVDRGSITNAGGKKDAVWLESAVVDRLGKGWCVAFLHSTVVKGG
jgi:ketosteroid isomerase-like protein